MPLLDDVKTFVLSLKKLKLADKLKAEKIKEFILNIDDIADNTKKVLFVSIKTFVISSKILKDPSNVSLINSTELYDRCIKQSNIIRDTTEVVEVDTDIIKKILNLKYDKQIIKNTSNYRISKYSLYSYLLFTSGLRTNEITNNSFTIIDYNTIKAERISKKPFQDTANIINLLIPATEWLELFNQLQLQLSKQDLTISAISLGIKKKLGDIHPDLTAHSLRKLYLAYHLQIKKTGADKIPSINTKNLLNHSNENASVYYTGTVQITGELADIIDNTDYSKLKVRELQQLLTEREIYWHPKMLKAKLIANLRY